MNFDWRQLDDETIEYHFNPRLTIPNAMDLIGELPGRAERARESLSGEYDVRYGPGPKECFDIFAAASDSKGAPPPAQIFIHGGYWRAMDKNDYSHLATDVVAVLDQEGIKEPVYLVGHAFGNRIARAFASRHAERVRATVLLSAGGEAPTPAPVRQAIQTVLLGFWSPAARDEAAKLK